MSVTVETRLMFKVALSTSKPQKMDSDLPGHWDPTELELASKKCPMGKRG